MRAAVAPGGNCSSLGAVGTKNKGAGNGKSNRGSNVNGNRYVTSTVGPIGVLNIYMQIARGTGLEFSEDLASIEVRVIRNSLIGVFNMDIGRNLRVTVIRIPVPFTMYSAYRRGLSIEFYGGGKRRLPTFLS